jgi:hypothetical protein
MNRVRKFIRGRSAIRYTDWIDYALTGIFVIVLSAVVFGLLSWIYSIVPENGKTEIFV